MVTVPLAASASSEWAMASQVSPSTTRTGRSPIRSRRAARRLARSPPAAPARTRPPACAAAGPRRPAGRAGDGALRRAGCPEAERSSGRSVGKPVLGEELLLGEQPASPGGPADDRCSPPEPPGCRKKSSSNGKMHNKPICVAPDSREFSLFARPRPAAPPGKRRESPGALRCGARRR